MTGGLSVLQPITLIRTTAALAYFLAADSVNRRPSDSA